MASRPRRPTFDELTALVAERITPRFQTPPHPDEMAAEFAGDPELLRRIRDIEIELEEPESIDVSHFGYPEQRATLHFPQPCSPRFVDFTWRQSPSMFRERYQALACFTIHFGDHREQWHMEASAFERHGWGRDHLLMEMLCLALTVGVRRQMRAVLAEARAGDRFRDDLRRRLPTLTWDGRRARSFHEYEEFIGIGDYPRPPMVRHVMQTARERPYRAELERLRRDPANFMQECMGAFDVGVDEGAQENSITVVEQRADGMRANGLRIDARMIGVLSELGRPMERAATAGLEAFVAGLKLGGRSVNEDGMWFDHHTLSREVDTRAERLLLDHLSEAQRAEYVREKRITVEARSGRAYVIHRKRTYNVTQLSRAGLPKRQLCVVTDTPYSLPIADVMLMQMILLRNDEAGYLKTANSCRLDGKGERR